jgi:hypothetical protein
MSHNTRRHCVVAAFALVAGGLCVGLNLTGRAGENVGTFVTHTVAAIERRRFLVDMARYEAACGQSWAIYASGDIEAAKQALSQVIELSLAERKNAKRYWAFNLVIAYAQARLAVIAEYQGRREEAERLFKSASIYMVLQSRALAHEQGQTGMSDSEARFSPARWRYIVAALDKRSNVHWRENATKTAATTAAIGGRLP